MRLACLSVLICLVSIFGAAATAGTDETATNGERQQALFFKLKPSLITNVQGAASYLRCDIQLMTKNEDKLEQIRLHEPALRHELLLLLGDQQGDQVKTNKGKEKLRKSALKAVNEVMGGMDCKTCIDNLYFTSFFVQ